jgi:hypothetical protein
LTLEKSEIDCSNGHLVALGRRGRGHVDAEDAAVEVMAVERATLGRALRVLEAEKIVASFVNCCVCPNNSFVIYLFIQRLLVPLLLNGPPFFPNILLLYTTLLTRMTSIYLHILAMASDFTIHTIEVFSKTKIVFFHFGSNST